MRARPHRDEGALVLGANYRGLGMVRSLGRRGAPVWVVHSDEHKVASWSRYASRTLPWPDGDDARVSMLLDLAAREGLDGWALFPTDDETMHFLSRHAVALGSHYRVAAPAAEIISIAYDKRETHRRAAALGIPQPWTAFPRDRAEVANMVCGFPVVLKPAVKAASNPFTDAKAWRVNDRVELVRRYDEACSYVDPSIIMVQELIYGDGAAQLSFSALCRDGAVLASASAQRLRQSPMDFGTASSYVETTGEVDAGAYARRMLADLRFTGIVEVEFKRDARDGRPKLLDVNARVWGWHTVCERAGVDMTALWWDVLRGQRVEPAAAVAGVRWVRMSTDVPTVAREIGAGRMTLAGYLRSLRPPLAFAIFARDDPTPAFVDLPLLAWVAVRRWGRRRLRAASLADTRLLEVFPS
jgi:D-aspartate ligase